jgi:hypothetical protein
MGYYAASSGISLLMFWDNLLVPFSKVNHHFFFGFLILQDGTNRLSQKNGKELPLLAA